MNDSLILPPLGPIVDDSYKPAPAQTAREHFSMQFYAMLHYTRSVQERYSRNGWGEPPLHMFSCINSDNHGFGDFLVLSLDDIGVVASMAHTQSNEQGWAHTVWTPQPCDTPDYGNWAHVAQHVVIQTQLSCWSHAIRELNLVRYRGGDNHRLFDMLARVPTQR